MLCKSNKLPSLVTSSTYHVMPPYPVGHVQYWLGWPSCATSASVDNWQLPPFRHIREHGLSKSPSRARSLPPSAATAAASAATYAFADNERWLKIQIQANFFIVSGGRLIIGTQSAGFIPHDDQHSRISGVSEGRLIIQGPPLYHRTQSAGFIRLLTTIKPLSDFRIRHFAQFLLFL